MALNRSVRRLSDVVKNGVSDGGSGVGERGLYFPIKHRVVDCRLHPDVAMQAEVQSRFRRELRSHIITGETRQVTSPRWSSLQRPTHFLSLPLPLRCGLRVLAKEIRDSILFTHPNVEPLLIPDAKLHVTLSVFTLPSPVEQKCSSTRDLALPSPTLFSQERLIRAIKEEVQEIIHRELLSSRSRSKTGMQSLAGTGRRDLNHFFLSSPSSSNTANGGNGLHLRFSGLGTFSDGRVLFARCLAENDFSQLDRVVRAVRHYLGSRLGLDVKGNPYDGFVPHVTLGKIRKHQKGIVGEAFPPSLWADYQFNDFGDVHFSQVDLCRMRWERNSSEAGSITPALHGNAADESDEENSTTTSSFRRSSKEYYPVCFSLPLR